MKINKIKLKLLWWILIIFIVIKSNRCLEEMLGV